MNFPENQPLVSVLMTVYNREKYISQAIESVLDSTYKNWELIIVDDQSKDNSVKIAREFETKDNRIKVYVNDKNLGDYPNRNQAASYATGKYLKYVDADDLIYPFGLEQLVYYMEQFPEAGYGLCSLPQYKFKKYPYQLTPVEAYQSHYFKKALFNKAPLSAIINKKIFHDAGEFTGKRMLGDFEMWHILSQKFPVVLMPQGIVWYREHDEQEMSLHRNDPMEPFKYLLLADDLLNSKDCPLNSTDRQNALQRNRHKKCRAIVAASKHHSIKKALELKKVSGLSYFKIFRNSIK